MRTLLTLLIVLLVPLLFIVPLGCAHQLAAPEARPETLKTETYSTLATKDLDQMTALVNQRILESQRSEGDKLTPLKAGLLEVYGRPDEDGMIDKVVGPLKNEIEEVDSWDKAVGDVTEEAILVLKSPDSHTPAAQVTYAVFLENVIAEAKPRAKKPGFERNLLETIRDADIELPKSVRDERRLRMMRDTSSPSQQARQILERLQLK